MFADDLSGFLERDEKNLRNFARILVNFHKVSGLATNLDKTCVIPVGDFLIPNYCHDLKLKWESSFKVLGIVIDNRLEKLEANLDRIFDKVESKILHGLAMDLQSLVGSLSQKVYSCHNIHIV